MVWSRSILAGFLLAGLQNLSGSVAWRPDPYGLVPAGIVPGDGSPVERPARRPGGEVGRALAAFEGGDPDAAADHLVRAVLLDPGDLEARRALAALWLEAQEPEAALGQLRILDEASPDDPENLYQMAAAYNALGQSAEALACAGGAAELRPTWSPAFVRLGLVKAQAGDRPGGEADLLHALELPGVTPEGMFEAGNHFLEVGQPATAVVFFRRALALRPDYSWAANNLGNALRATNQPEPARQAYQVAIAADATNPNPHNGLGVLREAAGDLVGALESYRAALRVDPGYMDARYNAGVVLLKLGKSREAFAELEAARKLRPDYAPTYLQLAEALLKLGDAAAAEAYHRKATALDPRIDKETR